MGGDAVDFLCATALHNTLGCCDPAAGFVDHVIDDEDSSIPYIANQCDHLLQGWVIESLFLFV
jgi:hypothetical protein